MARRSREDRALDIRLSELEENMMHLKVMYDKYFSGLERIEPLRQREDIQRDIRGLMTENITNTALRFRFQGLRARWTTLSTYITRNMVLIERGTHPKMIFRANAAERARADAASAREQRQQRQMSQKEREETAIRQLFDTYIDARRACGQSTDLEYESVRSALRNQARQIKGRYQCSSVKFRVSVEDGRAKLKAVPIR